MTDPLLDEHAGDEEAVQAKEAIQDVTELGVVQRHCLCGDQRSEVRHGYSRHRTGSSFY